MGGIEISRRRNRCRPLLHHRRSAAAALMAASMSAGFGYATQLDPTSFTSLGTFNVTSGGITFNTTSLLAITATQTFTGVSQAQAGGPNIAVFDFANFNLGS